MTTNNNNTFNEYCTGMPIAGGQCLHVAMVYPPHSGSHSHSHSHHNTTLPLSPSHSHSHHHITLHLSPSASPSPSHSPPPPPAPYLRDDLPPPYEEIDSSPPPFHPITTLPPSPSPLHSHPLSDPPPPYEEVDSSPRPLPSITLPPLSSVLASMGAAPSFPPPPYTPLPPTPSPSAPRLPVYHARFMHPSHEYDSSQDRHALFVLTRPQDPRERGIYIQLLETRRRALRLTETIGNAPDRSPLLRACTFLGTVSGDGLDTLQDLSREVYREAMKKTAQRRKPLAGGVACRFLHYTTEMPPPPYSAAEQVFAPEPLASPSQAWVAAVIELAQAQEVLRRD